jgi:hypothetical protein
LDPFILACCDPIITEYGDHEQKCSSEKLYRQGYCIQKGSKQVKAHNRIIEAKTNANKKGEEHETQEEE